MASELKIVRATHVTFPGGYCGEKRVQVTEVRLGSVVAWVREWRAASGIDHFVMSSGQRLGHKADGNRVGREVLQLAAPPHAWDAIARAVRALDSLKRPVQRHPQWTVRTAPEWFKNTYGRRLNAQVSP